VRSHDLNRLLDEPGLVRGGTMLFLLEISFPPHRPPRALVGSKPDGGDDLRPSLQWRAARAGYFCNPISLFLLFLAESSHSTRWALVRWL
jgi:hypothetical protein